MSLHLAIDCACGEVDLSFSRTFTELFWHDNLGALEKLGIDNPYNRPWDELTVEGHVFAAWMRATLERMRAHRAELPQAYQSWRQVDAETLWSDAGYCRYGDRVLMVEGSSDLLGASPLLPEQWEQRREHVPYELPVLEERLPGVVLETRPPIAGFDDLTPITPEEFERLFQDTPVSLQWGDLLEFLAGEVEQLENAARHLETRREGIIIFQI